MRNIRYLSFNNFITHFVAKIICFLIVIGIAISFTRPPVVEGNNKTSGVILLIAIKKINKGSTPSLFFKPYFISIKYVKAHNFLPQ
jgi:hypothetical protein